MIYSYIRIMKESMNMGRQKNCSVVKSCDVVVNFVLFWGFCFITFMQENILNLIITKILENTQKQA